MAYIELEKALRAFDTEGSRFVYGLRTCRAVQSRLMMVPAADVRETKHALWIEDAFTSLIKCSACGNDAPLDTTGGGQYKSRFCPSCGADMRAGVE